MVTWVLVAAVVYAGFVVAFQYGLAPDGAVGQASIYGGAWVALKLTQPLRLGATVILTPLVARTGRAMGWWRPDASEGEGSGG